MRSLFIVLSILLTAIPVVTHAGLFGPSNYAECILKYMPETTDRPSYLVAKKKCYDDFPEGYVGVEKKSSIFGVMSREECYQKYLQPLNTAWAKLDIKTACGVLYYSAVRR